MGRWSEEEVLAHGNRFLEDQRAERLKTARGLHDALAELTPDARLMTRPVEAKPARRPRNHPEHNLEKTCSDLLALDGWRLLKTDPVSDRRRGKGFGELGMADCLYIRYNDQVPLATMQSAEIQYRSQVELLWYEWKAPGGKPSPAQRVWIAEERARGALVWLAGTDFPASVDGFLDHYRGSGLMRRPI